MNQLGDQVRALDQRIMRLPAQSLADVLAKLRIVDAQDNLDRQAGKRDWSAMFRVAVRRDLERLAGTVRTV